MNSGRQHLARLIFAFSFVSLVSLPASSSAGPVKVHDPGAKKSATLTRNKERIAFIIFNF